MKKMEKKSLRASEAVKRRKAAVLRPRFRGTALQVAQGSGKGGAAAQVSPKVQTPENPTDYKYVTSTRIDSITVWHIEPTVYKTRVIKPKETSSSRNCRNVTLFTCLQPSACVQA